MGTEGGELATVKIRPASANDVLAILALVRELAEYERLAHLVVATEDSLRESLFGPRPQAEVLLAELDGEIVGQALFFTNYSTFLGRGGMYLEDLYVRPHARKRGVGTALFAELARIGVARGIQRMEWAVLDWNQPSIEFYKSLGAQPLDEWTVYRLGPEAIAHLAARGI
jgi:GNAT superfamily N-acetyltransferase